jgi:hypothetical protein
VTTLHRGELPVFVALRASIDAASGRFKPEVS